MKDDMEQPTSMEADGDTLNSNEGETITSELHDNDSGNNESTTVVPAEEPRQDNRSYECDVCFMKFTQFANMRRHKLSHSGIRPFECRLCSRRFFRKDHLVEHTVRKHSKQRPLRCPFCAKTFPTVPLLKCHLSNNHSSGYNPKENICSICGFVATTPGGAKIHYMTYHVRRALRPSSPPPMRLSALLGHYPSQQPDMTIGTLGGDSFCTPVAGGTPSEMQLEYQEISPRITNVRSQQEESKENEDEGTVIVKTEVQSSEADKDGDEEDTVSSNKNGEEANAGTWTMSSQEHSFTVGTSQWNSTAISGNDLGIVISPPPQASGAYGVHPGEEKLDEKQRSTPETSTADGDSGVDMRCPTAFACHYCDVVFYDRTLYLLHRGMHSLHRPWRCNLCGHLCKHRYDFASHIIAHSHA